MSNMSYCRFQNTYQHLRQCAAAIEDGEYLSREEADAAKNLLALCSRISSGYSIEDIQTQGDSATCEHAAITRTLEGMCLDCGEMIEGEENGD